MVQRPITRVLLGGPILTMARPARVEAIALAGDRIAALGTREEMLGLRDARTEVVDLRGAALRCCRV
jgi:predicted amidohydrolase YtcJ